MSIVTVKRSFEFSASHSLPYEIVHNREDEKEHLHDYKLDVLVEGPVVNGVVVPMQVINDAVGPLIRKLEGQYLNDVFDLPTMENVAVWAGEILRGKIKGLRSVTVHETEKNSATYIIDEKS